MSEQFTVDTINPETAGTASGPESPDQYPRHQFVLPGWGQSAFYYELEGHQHRCDRCAYLPGSAADGYARPSATWPMTPALTAAA